MSLIILVLGILVVLAIYLRKDDQRTVEAAKAIRVGDDSASVLTGLGVPAARCPAGSLGHLRDALPPGTPRPMADETLEQLRRGTTIRWVWGNAAACNPRSGHTEVGFGADGRVLWAVAEHGGSPATLP